MDSRPPPLTLCPAQGERRRRVLQAAQAAFVTPQASVTFLTNCHGQLGGQPLDLAIVSEAGLLRVERAIYAERYLTGAAS